ncbi:MAG: L,D-transpeptidase [Anaerolineae bacterium]|jgi:hypothetical protein|nr:L,D-transpeptidase [Anaerolineae bacterium]MBT3712604.1 L,D-transpeptidase [Anaerolineae bacterium]MBT4459126.1 L,D-transpeptidase [Anaerolineae bacterium]MBT4840911.1 L,D-transpeptidase [Anaerolineae bacterium]MBT6060719.1 L,D-transpeptidase [Anaerolineae bacterium]
MKNFSRRDFLKLTGASLGAMAFRRLEGLNPSGSFQFPEGEKLGRVSVFPNYYATRIRTEPYPNAPVVRDIGEDELIIWLREVVGGAKSTSKRWVETPEGYIYAPDLQPVHNFPNIPLTAMLEGRAGFWAEVTVPYVDLWIANPPARAGWYKDSVANNFTPRLYYGQVLWVDQIMTTDAGKVMYRFNEKYGYGDIFWVDAAGIYPLTPEDIAPIHPDVDPVEKHILVNTTYQTLSCFEGEREIFFCRISTGYESESYFTPPGGYNPHRKLFSIPMGASSTEGRSGYDTPAVGWPIFMNGDGIAIHAAFWHNDFGTRRSHGCVNVCAEDAKWLFRWTTPYLSLDTDEVSLAWPDHGTKVKVVKRTF